MALQQNLTRLSWVLLAGLWAYTIFAITQLPDTIPIHFNFHDEADNWGSKYTLLALAGIATFILGLFYTIKRASLDLNYPVKLTEENKPRQQELAFGLLSALACAIPILFAVIIYSTMKYVEHGSFDFPDVLMLSLIFGPIVIYFILAYRNR